MKRLTMVTGALLALALVAVAAPASSKTGAYRHYVACGLSEKAKPAHVCQKKRDKGAFFRSNLADVFYTVCVRFPTGKHACKGHQEAVQGTLYVNKITSNISGRHTVSWFVSGKKVGEFIFVVSSG